MADAVNIPSLGAVELTGEGPWMVDELNRMTWVIRDSKGAECSIAITGPARGGRGTKRNANLTFAKREPYDTIVAAFNASLESSNG